MSSKCWCGSEHFLEFNKDYDLCASCNTLVWKEKNHNLSQTIFSEEEDYYGARYWLEHQREMGLPDIYERIDSDWLDRIPYWLNKILKYKLPPASAVEIGCSHGGLMAGMKWLGYNPVGIELSPQVVDLARKTYDVPVYTGQIEDQNFQPNSMDMVILMDVLEHLSNPVRTLTACRQFLKPDGLLVIQTPKFPEKDFNTLRLSQHPFLRMLIPHEHQYLFSVSGIKKLLKMIGFTYFAFEPPVFPYDMFLFASSQPLVANSPEVIDNVYRSSGTARMVKVILNLNQNFSTASMKLSELNKTIQEQAKQNQVLQIQNQELKKQNQEYQSIIESLVSSNTYRFIRGLGRLSWLDAKIHQLETKKEKNTLPEKPLNPQDFRLKVAIDLTPVLPGGINGGAKLLALNLVKFWSRELAPHWEYILLTSDTSHDELAWLDNSNVRRVCVNITRPKTISATDSIFGKIKHFLLTKVQQLVGSYRLQRIFSIYQRLVLKPKAKNILEDLNADIIFCPFTAPFYYSPKIPIVLVVHDLQYLYYPQFFTPEEIYHTHRYFQQSTQVATKLICISEYTRKTVLENSSIDPQKVVTIPNNILNPLPQLSFEEEDQTLKNLGLHKGEYLFYPANFWQHKNHSLLLIAFNVYLQRNPQSKLHLVFSGAPSSRMSLLQEATKRMDIEHRVHFMGYLSDREFSAVLSGSKALIFPSLFEGFGVPVLEAMTHRKPVFCSNATSLPEVVADAAYTFDPHRIEEVISAIEQADRNSSLLSSLSQKGYERANQWMTPLEWASKYLQVLLQSIEEMGKKK